MMQSALNGKLDFAKQESPIFIDEKDQKTTLSSVVNLAPKLAAALEELLENRLIRWDHRIVAVHRVVQEAMNWSGKDELQESFDSVVRLVYEGMIAQLPSNLIEYHR